VAAASTSPSQAPANTQQAIATIEEKAPAATAALAVQRPPDVASSAHNQKQKKHHVLHRERNKRIRK